jgi:hypothetical protein
VPAVAGDVADLDGLREIGVRLASAGPAESAPAAVREADEPEPVTRV